MNDDLLMGAVHTDMDNSALEGVHEESVEAVEAETTGVEAKGESFVPDHPMGYGDFSLPEEMVVDGQMDEGFKSLAQEIGLPKGSAQKLVDFYAEAQARQMKDYHHQVQAWKDQAMGDAELGGHRWAESQRHIAKARDVLGGQEFVDFVEATGIGNHPALLRFCMRAGKMLSEDSSIEGSSQLGSSRNAADVLFGDLTR